MAVALVAVADGSAWMGKLAAVVVAAVIGMTLGVALVVVLGDGEVPQQASVPVSLATSAPVAVDASDGPDAPADPQAPQEPSVAAPVRVVIPAIDVDAELVALGLNDDNSMEVPNFGLAGWYEPGPRPGAPGPAVIAAHVDSVAGPDVFYRLRELGQGDEITVELSDGEEAIFEVDRSEQQRKDDLPVDRIWNDTDDVVLRLITCGGEFDRSQRSYESNVIVYASGA
ncbi:MAG TPA: class F sortase [Euzebyales bacterium]|nr:class F sortase [Euzebyales bacterium]